MSSPFAGANGFSIDTFKSNFNGAAKPYMFYVKLSLPAPIGDINENSAMYLVQSSELPGRKIEKKSVKWQGYEFPLGGITTHEPWKVTFMCDPQADLYKSFVAWANFVHDPRTNVHGLPQSYMADQYVQLLDNAGEKGIMDIKLIGCWPSDVQTIELNMESNDIIKFTVTFEYVRHEYEGVDY